MRTVICLLSVMVVTVVTVSATTYSCRDREGQLHVTDNLQALPEECRGKATIMQPDTPDNLNFVPQKNTPTGSDAEYQKNVREVEREIQQKQLHLEEYVKRAEQLTTQYRQAVQEKRQATRRWDYGSRDVILQADKRIEKIREGKQQLLNDLRGQGIPREEEQKIRERLKEISDQ